MDNNKSIYAAEEFYKSGRELMKLERFEDAITAFEKALEIDPFYENAFFAIIEALIFKKDFIGAENRIESSFYFQNRYIRSLAALADVKYNMKDYESALHLLDEVISISASYPGAFTMRGIVKQFLGDYIEAQKDIETALFINLKDGEALREKGLLRLREGDAVEARHYLTQAAHNLDKIAQDVLYEIIAPRIFSLTDKHFIIKTFKTILEHSAKNNLQIIIHDDADYFNNFIGISYLKAVRDDPEYFCIHFGLENKSYINLIKSISFTSMREIDYWIDKSKEYILYSGIFKNPFNGEYNNLDGISKKDNIKYLALLEQNKMDVELYIYDAKTGKQLKNNL